jgi:myo-inositol-1(or 4)-monophosphatase
MTRPRFAETYTAIRGEGAYLNGKLCVLRKTAGMDDAVLSCNIAHRAVKKTDGTLSVPIPFCASIENYGNAIEEFAVVLKGWNDGVFFKGPKLWDTAAGCLMIEEAGGKSRTELKEKDDDRSGVLCAASTKEIFEEIEEFVFKTLKASP